MQACTFGTMGEFYLLHFSRPLGNPANPRALAGHYLGWAWEVEARLEAHLRNQSEVKIVQACHRAGIALTPVRLGPAPKRAEWWLKQCWKQNLRQFRPICMQGRPKALPANALQLPLDWVGDDDPTWDFDQVPDVGPTKEWDSYRILHALEQDVDQATLMDCVRAFQHQLSSDFTAIQAMIVLGTGDPRQARKEEV